MGWLSIADLLSALAVAWIFLQVREFSGGRDLDTPGAACVLRGAVGREGGGEVTCWERSAASYL